MILEQITFTRGKVVPAVKIADLGEVPSSLEILGIHHPKSVIVLVGGAGGMSWREKFPMRKAIAVISQIAEETASVVIDGGTQSGMMLEMGKQRKSREYGFPLIGVVHQGLLSKRVPQEVLDKNHSHFIFIPGDHWGDESCWIAKIATILAGQEKSMTILINGGRISQIDVENSLAEKRTTVILRGTGRLADEIILTGALLEANISQKHQELLSFLRSRLS